MMTFANAASKSQVKPIVFVVDDDVSVRESLELLISFAVMRLVVAGMLNKQVGLKLGISEITVKAHRGKMMLKMQADSVADLVRIAMRLGLTPAKNPWHVTHDSDFTI